MDNKRYKDMNKEEKREYYRKVNAKWRRNNLERVKEMDRIRDKERYWNDPTRGKARYQKRKEYHKKYSRDYYYKQKAINKVGEEE